MPLSTPTADDGYVGMLIEFLAGAFDPSGYDFAVAVYELNELYSSV